MLAIDRDQVLCERLNRHPLLRARVESLLGVEKMRRATVKKRMRRNVA